MLNEFKEHIEKTFPEIQKEPFLIACSGGVDSTVLVHLCAALKLDFGIAHCNFKLRGKESEKDAKFVGQLADKLQKPYYIKSFKTESYANRNKLSIQMAARELRYEWFKELVKEKGYSWLLTAHHLDDQLETFLINLSRGSGIEGLAGIPGKTDWVARPLLGFSREQIVLYASEQGLEWREDASNTDTKYLRNQIRHELLPKLKELHPTFLKNFKNSLSYLSGSAAILEQQADELRNRLFQSDADVIRVDCNKLSQLQPLDAYLHLLFKDYGFTEWSDLQSLLTAVSGKEIRSKTHRLLKDRDELLLAELRDGNYEEYEVFKEDKGQETPFRLVKQEVKAIEETGKRIIYVDKETLNPKLVVRKWKKGDYFYPLGMQGKKKVSKFFKDEKMDIIAKEKQWLLCSGDDIVWILGRRADDRFKVTDATGHILKITWLE
ncbi:tRNA lysidine(34) synthetase TilS [Flavobacteriaceae bacterium R33]|uniref:tRNA(Ile)-lysidine synthase n=1 Tax=Poritiphilus flavus TaxID=2697053 RepID=A0A6L9EEH6_9FLAO|nr:tRNA lysidine(34) synthetase TilS [Poritiphilus flavus]